MSATSIASRSTPDLRYAAREERLERKRKKRGRLKEQKKLERDAIVRRWLDAHQPSPEERRELEKFKEGLKLQEDALFQSWLDAHPETPPEKPFTLSSRLKTDKPAATATAASSSSPPVRMPSTTTPARPAPESPPATTKLAKPIRDDRVIVDEVARDMSLVAAMAYLGSLFAHKLGSFIGAGVALGWAHWRERA
jgi:hypothetical protein